MTIPENRMDMMPAARAKKALTENPKNAVVSGTASVFVVDHMGVTHPIV